MALLDGGMISLARFADQGFLLLGYSNELKIDGSSISIWLQYSFNNYVYVTPGIPSVFGIEYQRIIIRSTAVGCARAPSLLRVTGSKIAFQSECAVNVTCGAYDYESGTVPTGAEVAAGTGAVRMVTIPAGATTGTITLLPTEVQYRVFCAVPDDSLRHTLVASFSVTPEG